MRNLFRQHQQAEGWLAINFMLSAVCVVHIKRVAGARPLVTHCSVHEVDSANAAAMEKLGRDLRLQRYRITTLLRSDEYQMLVVEAPNVPPAELRTAVRWRVKDMLDFHVDDATIDLLDIPVDKNAPQKSHSMIAVAARNHEIQRRVNLFEEIQVPLSVIDIPELAQRNIATFLEEEGRGVAMLSIGEERGLLTFTAHGELYFSRQIDVSLTQLINADESQRQTYFERITLALQRSIDHFDRQFHYITANRLVIAPLPADVGLLAYLSSNLYVPVESLDLATVLDFSKVPELSAPEQQARCFLGLGGALRLEQKSL